MRSNLIKNKSLGFFKYFLPVAIGLAGLQAEASFVYYKLDGTGSQQVIISGLRMNSDSTFWWPTMGKIYDNISGLKNREGTGSASPTTLTPSQIAAIKSGVTGRLQQLTELSQVLLNLSKLIVSEYGWVQKRAYLDEFKAGIAHFERVLTEIRQTYSMYGSIFSLEERALITDSITKFSQILENGKAFVAKESIQFLTNDTSVGDTYASSSKSRQAKQIYSSGGTCTSGICYLTP